ncbi:MAG TPA: hypothetical protein VGG75_11710 [Trebonia sp.]
MSIGPASPVRTRRAAALAVVMAAGIAGLAGCSPSTASPAAAPAPGGSGTQLLAAALKNAANVSSYTAPTTVKATGLLSGTTPVTLSGTYSSKDKRAVREFNATTVDDGALPLGAMDEVTTSSTLYVKMATLTTLLRATKPWVKIPTSSLSSGSGLVQMLGEAQSADPLDAAELLNGAQNARTAGTSTVDGVAVTEITGTETAAQAQTGLSASQRAAVSQVITKTGLRQITFQVWVDSQKNLRKLTVAETGSKISESITMTVTSMNKPVSIAVPPASQAAPLPANAAKTLSALMGSGGL